MSVAFRRESDEEHLEPRFELPIPSGPNLVTPRGLALIAERLAALEGHLAAAPPEEREKVMRDLRYWRTRSVTATLAPPPPTDQIAFGSRVRVLVKGAERLFELVGDDEAEPGTGRIAFSSPLARALIGAAEGERVEFGEGIDVIEIIAPPP